MRQAAGPQTISLGEEIVGRINELGAISETPEHLDAHLPHHGASRGGRPDPVLDARGRHARASRCDRQCLRPLRRRAAGPAVPDARLALRHRPRRRQMGRPARADHGDFLRRRSEPARAAIAVRDRGDRLRRRGGRALRLDAARQPRGRRHLRSRACSAQETRPEFRCARRWSQFGLDPDHIGAAARAPTRTCSPMSNCTSSRGRCWKAENLPVGVVTAIAGATRLAASLTGMAGHAGTVPMTLRRDALAGAAECIVAIEEFCRTDEDGLVGTVGYIHAMPGATNVIPGQVVVHHRYPRADRCASQARGDRYRPAASKPSPSAASWRCSSTSPTRTAPCPARPG